MEVLAKGIVRRRSILLLAALALSSFTPALWAATYYVDQNHPAASDANSGTADKPWSTLYRAMEADLKPGDSVLVKEGRYLIDRGGAWNQPAISPRGSGTADRPITIKAVPRHGVELLGKGGDAPLIGSFRQHHIVIDGFVVSNPGVKGIGVFGTAGQRARGVVIQNNIVRGIYIDNSDNADGIRIERASGAIVRNNRIHDVGNAARSSNAAGIKLYWSDNILIENNEIFDVVAGIKEKENGEFIDVRRNYVYDCSFGIEIMNQNSLTTQSYRVYENIFDCGTGVESKTVSSATMKDIYIYNNVFANYTAKAVNGTKHGSNRRIWNNIFYRPGGAPTQGEFVTYNDPPREIELMDYNLYYQDPKNVIGLYDSNRTFNGLAAWQGSGFGANSKVADPMFMDAAGGDFRLAPQSPARGAGRVDGRSSGAAVDMGAYPREGTVVGLMWSGSNSLPAAPQQLSVE